MVKKTLGGVTTYYGPRCETWGSPEREGVHILPTAMGTKWKQRHPVVNIHLTTHDCFQIQKVYSVHVIIRKQWLVDNFVFVFVCTDVIAVHIGITHYKVMCVLLPCLPWQQHTLIIQKCSVVLLCQGVDHAQQASHTFLAVNLRLFSTHVGSHPPRVQENRQDVLLLEL